MFGLLAEGHGVLGVEGRFLFRGWQPLNTKGFSSWSPSLLCLCVFLVAQAIGGC